MLLQLIYWSWKESSYLLTRPVHDGTLEFHHGAADLVAEGGLALLVVHLSAGEETVAAGSGGGGSCCVTVSHFE